MYATPRPARCASDEEMEAEGGDAARGRMSDGSAPPGAERSAGGASTSGTVAPAPAPPGQTVYVNNLNEKVRPSELRTSLYALFSPLGRVLDVVAQRSLRARGQAWVVFESQAMAEAAVVRLQGTPFYGKPMRVQFARGKSDAVARAQGTFVPRARRDARRRRREKLEEHLRARNRALDGSKLNAPP